MGVEGVRLIDGPAYFNHLEGRYEPLDGDRWSHLTYEQRQVVYRRWDLIEGILQEMEAAETSSEIRLFLGMAARSLVGTEQQLIRQFSERLARMTPRVSRPPSPPVRRKAR